MAEQAVEPATGSQWQWNGEQWLWWDGTQWIEAGVGAAEDSAAGASHGQRETEGAAGDAPPGGTKQRVLSVIPNASLQAGFMGLDSHGYSLVLSDDRIVFAPINDGLMWQMSKEEQSRAHEQGMGRLDQWAAGMQAWDRLIEMYVQRGPDGILADDPGSFAVNRADVTKVKLTSTGNGTAGYPRLDYLIIKAAGTKYKMLLAGGKDYARSALQAAGLM